MSLATVLDFAISTAAFGASDELCERYSPGEPPPLAKCDEGPDADAASAFRLLPKEKQTTLALYLAAVDAYRAVTTRGTPALLVEVRTRPEVAYLGMPLAADANVPFLNVSASQAWDDQRGELALERNSSFMDQVEARLAAKGLTKTDAVILTCRSGTRRAKAVDLLARHGLTRGYSVVDGYEGDLATSRPDVGHRVVNRSRNAGLPWSYKIERARLSNDGFGPREIQ